MARNKYGNRKATTSDGLVHDSQKEAKRWGYLNTLQEAGLISDLRTQVEYELIPAQYETYERYGKNGKRLKDGVRLLERKCMYVADFVYIDENGNTVVEDVKGYRDPSSAGYAKFVIKRKLMLHIHGLRITEI